MAQSDIEGRLERLEEAVAEVARKAIVGPGSFHRPTAPNVTQILEESDERHRAECERLGVATTTERALLAQLKQNHG